MAIIEEDASVDVVTTDVEIITQMLVPDEDDSPIGVIQKSTRLSIAINQIFHTNQTQVILPSFMSDTLDINMYDVDVINLGGVSESRAGLIRLISHAAVYGLQSADQIEEVPEDQFEPVDFIDTDPQTLDFFYDARYNLLSWRPCDPDIEVQSQNPKQLPLVSHEKDLLKSCFMEALAIS